MTTADPIRYYRTVLAEHGLDVPRTPDPDLVGEAVSAYRNAEDLTAKQSKAISLLVLAVATLDSAIMDYREQLLALVAAER